jgi:chemosensory pili system protein ChpA (sensor histidine kinase/response regulator)
MAPLGMAFSLGATVGPGIGGHIADAYGLAAPFYFVGGALLCAALNSHLMLPETRPPVAVARVDTSAAAAARDTGIGTSAAAAAADVAADAAPFVVAAPAGAAVRAVVAQAAAAQAAAAQAAAAQAAAAQAAAAPAPAARLTLREQVAADFGKMGPLLRDGRMRRILTLHAAFWFTMRWVDGGDDGL